MVAHGADNADGAFPPQLLVERVVGDSQLHGIGQGEAVPFENLLERIHGFCIDKSLREGKMPLDKNIFDVCLKTLQGRLKEVWI